MRRLRRVLVFDTVAWPQAANVADTGGQCIVQLNFFAIGEDNAVHDDSVNDWGVFVARSGSHWASWSHNC